jgi:hypothetical protein
MHHACPCSISGTSFIIFPHEVNQKGTARHFGEKPMRSTQQFPEAFIRFSEPFSVNLSLLSFLLFASCNDCRLGWQKDDRASIFYQLTAGKVDDGGDRSHGSMPPQLRHVVSLVGAIKLIDPHIIKKNDMGSSHRFFWRSSNLT